MVDDEDAGPVNSTRPQLSISPAAISVLVVDDDPQLRAAVKRDLEASGFSVNVAASADEALETLSRDPIDVLVTDLKMGARDGMDLLQEARQISPNTRSILMSAYATARDNQLALDLGAVLVLSKPFAPLELFDAIRKAIDCEVGFRGSIHGLSLVDMLQMFHFGRRSITIHINGSPPGRLHMHKGDLVHAECGETTGRAALQSLLSRPSGSMRTSALQTTERSLEASFDALLLDSLRELDETSETDTELDFGFEEPNSEQASESAPIDQGLAEAPPAGRAGRLRELIVRGVPGASAWQLPADGAPAVALVAEAGEHCDRGAVELLLASTTRLETAWTAVEAVTGTCSLAVIRSAGGQLIVVAANTTEPRAVQRFRSHVSRLSRSLQSEGTQ